MKHASLILPIVAVCLAGVALWKTPGPLLSTSSGLDAYDFSTPEAAFRSSIEAQANKDLHAMIEFGRLTQEEFSRTAKVEDSALFENRVVLFLSLEEDGKPVYKTQGMKRLHGKDIWVRDYISEYKVREDNPKLADRMQKWDKRGKQESDR